MNDAREVIAEERENNGGIKRRILDDNVGPSSNNSENGELDEKKIDLRIE